MASERGKCIGFEKKKSSNTETDDVSDLWSDEDDEQLLLLTSRITNDVEEQSTSNCIVQRADNQRKRRAEKDETDHAKAPRKDKEANVLQHNRKYLTVTDLVNQTWCELQVHYGFTLPTMYVENPTMTAGSNIHLTRELEVQDSVPVKVSSYVDVIAIKILNLLEAINSLLCGVQVRREIPIFGAPFGLDIFLMGVIDEIRVDPETFDWDINELKTRAVRNLPSKAQKRKNKIQVMIYKRLFDDLISGRTSKEMLEKHLGLNLIQEFGEDVSSYCKQFKCTNLDQLWNLLKDKIGAVPMISQLLVEYCFQEDKSTIAIENIPYDEAWLESKFSNHVKYWKGERKPQGVDIEEAGKCQKCDFADVCEWRKEKANEYRKKNVSTHKS